MSWSHTSKCRRASSAVRTGFHPMNGGALSIGRLANCSVPQIETRYWALSSGTTRNGTCRLGWSSRNRLNWRCARTCRDNAKKSWAINPPDRTTLRQGTWCAALGFWSVLDCLEHPLWRRKRQTVGQPSVPPANTTWLTQNPVAGCASNSPT